MKRKKMIVMLGALVLAATVIGYAVAQEGRSAEGERGCAGAQERRSSSSRPIEREGRGFGGGMKRRGCMEGGCMEGGCMEGGCMEGGCMEGGCMEGGCMEGGCMEGG
ncbi:MAG: hypothetical protein SVV80_00760, partial [Planctomycetota bacterium]|nr:hypothetical protein [Planctomycetota bacterium]